MATAKQALNDYSYYTSVLNLFEYDGWQTLPPSGREYRGDSAAFISQQANMVLTNSRVRDAAAYFRMIGITPEAYENPIEFAVARQLVRLVNRIERVPAELDAAFVKMALRNQQIWREARANANFDQYKPYMKELFELRKKIAEALDPDRSAYQVMVDMFDEGLDIQEVSRLFGELKEAIPHLLQECSPKFRQKSVPEISAISDPVKMQRVMERVIEQTGFSKENACFAKVLHPICYSIGPRDVRITLNYHAGVWPFLITSLHECGHGRYSYSSSNAVVQSGLWGCIDGSINEGVARFYENMIGRSKSFLRFAYPYVVEEFPEFKTMCVDDIYYAINRVCPGPIRISADELSYSLHPIIRFEMEKDYFDGKTSIDDFREIWNENYRKYLGVVPQNDREGVLQDISWSSGYLGYFQSYALGNMYSAQFQASILESQPYAWDRIEQGDFSPINDWMCEKLFQYGKIGNGSEAILRITGKSLSSKAYIHYLENKYI